jgi:hypothetical protein
MSLELDPTTLNVALIVAGILAGWFALIGGACWGMSWLVRRMTES